MGYRIRALLLVLGLLGACSGRSPEVIAVQDLPDDLAAAVDGAWARFLEAFSERRDCIAPVHVGFVNEVPDGDASYRREDGVISIQIPTSPGRFDESFVHELAHHLESTCPAQLQLRSDFLAAQGFPATASWNEGSAWHTTPSEHFAEAVVQLVNGRRLLHDDVIVLSDEAVQILSDWAAGH